MKEQIITSKKMTEKITEPKPVIVLSEHDVFPAARQKISCDKRSVVMSGPENNRVLFFCLLFFFTILAVF